MIISLLFLIIVNKLIFNDPRKFGFYRYIKNEKFKKKQYIMNLGIRCFKQKIK